MLTFFSSYKERLTTLIVSFFIVCLTANAQVPPSICSPNGGLRPDIISVATAFRDSNSASATVTIPAGATGAILTATGHSTVISTPIANPFPALADENFLSISANLDLIANSSSGVLNVAQNTNTNGSGTNLYTWIDVPFGTNVSTAIDKGQSTPNLLNSVTLSRTGNQLTITENNTATRTSYLVEFTSATTNSLLDLSTERVVFNSGGLSQSIAIPAGTDLIVLNKKGTVRISNWSSSGGTEEGFSNSRIIMDLDNNQTSGISTVVNGGEKRFRSTYGILNHSTASTSSFLNTTTGTLSGDFSNKSTTNSSSSDVGIEDPSIYISGGNLFINRPGSYASAFDEVYVVEFYERTGIGMSVSFIATRTAFIATGSGTTSGTARTLDIPAGSDYIFLKQAGNANNTSNEPNENSLEAYAIINLNNETATGYYYQQVGFGNATQRRDDNFAFVDLPLDGTSGRNPLYSDGYYTSGSNVYDIDFELSTNKSQLTITNKYGLVANNYQTITSADFFGRLPDLGFSTISSDFFTANNGSCGRVEISITVCNPGSGNSPGNFPVSFYDKDPTVDGTAKLIFLGNFQNAVPQGNCNNFSFEVDLKSAGYDDPNISVYCVVNDDGSFAPGGVGSAIGTPFSLADLATQNNPNYVECDYTNNLKSITISNTMACPEVDFLTTKNQSPILTGTWDNINTQTNGLEVTVNGVTYVLGTDTELSVLNNTWTLDLSGITLPIATYPVEAKTTNANGTTIDGTTNELVITDQGIVHLDLNGLTDNTINGTPISAPESQQLYVNFVRTSTGNVAATVAIASNGTYALPALTPGDYTFQLSTIQGTVGQPKPATSLPFDYVYTGEGLTGAGDGTPDGETAITYVNASTLVPNFGIQKRPTTGAPDVPGIVDQDVVQGTRYNPGIFGGFEIPSQAFGGSDDGDIENLLITALAVDILSITHDGTTYYRNSGDIPPTCPTSSCVAFPAAGVEIPANTDGQPLLPITLATSSTFLDGNLTLDYKTIDNAEFESSSTTTLTIPMIALKFEAGSWSNGSDGSNQPDLTDGDKTLFWVSDGGTLTVNATVKNLIIYSGVNATIDGVCLTVTDAVDNQGGQLVMEATTDTDYGQYLGPQVESTFEMIFENGWHNIGFPVNITAGQWAIQNNGIQNPNLVSITNNQETNNLQWYNSELSGGKEIGFFINRNGFNYSTHAYGQWNISQSTDQLITKGWNYFIDPFFSDTNPTSVIITGPTNDDSQTFTTHNNFGGWNLIPNIYPVSLSTQAMWNDKFFGDALVDDQNLYDKVILIWNPNDPYVLPLPGNLGAGAYIAIDPETGVALNAALDPTDNNDRLIAPFQSFYIRRSTASTVRRKDVDGTDNMGINDAVAVNASTDPALPSSGAGSGAQKSVSIKPLYRSACEITTNYKTQNNIDLLLLKVTDLESGSSDMTELAFANHYTNGFDQTYDIAKIGNSSGSTPTIFTKVQGQSLMINKMAIPEFSTAIPLGFYSTKNERPFAVSLEKNNAGYNIYLEDRLTGVWHDLNQGAYTFKNITSSNIERFKLHFNNGLRDLVHEPKLTAWGQNGNIELRFESMKTDFVDVLVTNLIGQVIYSAKNVSTQQAYSIPFSNHQSGIYVVRATGPQASIAVKVAH